MAKSATRFGQTRQFSNQAPAIGSGSSIPTIQFSSGNASALANFSRTLFGLSSQFEDQLDAQAEAEASKEGAIAGLAGDTTEMSYETIRGRAHNKAMLETFVTGLETNAMVGLTRLSQQYYNDPTGLENAANDYLAGMSSEVDKVAPGAGAAFRQRQAAKLLPAVERARDTRFQLTQDEANASLITHEASVIEAVKVNSRNLLSSNPALSQASAVAIAQTAHEYLRTFDAVDPATGKPLYSASDKAKAQVYIRDKIGTEAALGWFDSQPDPAKAYTQMMSDDFKIRIADKIALGGGPQAAKEFLATKSAHKSRPGDTANLDDQFSQGLAGLIQASPYEGLGLQSAYRSNERQTELFQNAVRKYGSAGAARRWVAPPGGSQHNHGKAADLSYNGRSLKHAPKEVIDWVHKNAKAYGLHFPMSHEPWHIEPLGTRGTKAPPPHPVKTETIERPLRQAMSEKAWNALDTEMRQRINFANSQYDRQQTQEKVAREAEQEAAATSVQLRIYSAGKTDGEGNEILPINIQEIDQFRAEGLLSEKQAQAFIKAIETEKPQRSDTVSMTELTLAMYNGENIQDDVNEAVGNGLLTVSDADTLLSKNRTINIQGDGNMSKAESDGMRDLEKLTEPALLPGLSLFQHEQMQRRAFDAKVEYKRRVAARGETGETIEEIVQDISARTLTGGFRDTTKDLSNLVLPRFAVVDNSDANKKRRIDTDASRNALLDAFDAGRIDEKEMYEQEKLITRWETLQTLADQLEAEERGVKGKR